MSTPERVSGLIRKMTAGRNLAGTPDRRTILKAIWAELETWSIEELRAACQSYACSISDLGLNIYEQDLAQELMP